MSKKIVKIGDINLGDGNIYIQSMLNILSSDYEGNVEQAIELEKAGCEILRVAIPDFDAVKLVDKIKSKIKIPLVADIHFDYKLALECVNAGIDKIRINPGNIGDEEKVKEVVIACQNAGVPIRIGVNSGSIEKSILEKYQEPNEFALVESALYHASLLEKFDYDDIVISIKSSNVITMIKAYEMLNQKCNYPLHLGVTEAGSKKIGTIKSSIGIGSLLAKGIGDTFRVSLTAPPVEEIFVAKDILKALGINKSGVNIVSCPTCGRTNIDLIKIVEIIEKKLENCEKKFTLAVMGCVVNGPGEAKEADIGIAGGKGYGVIFKKGKVLKKVDENMIIEELLKEIEGM
jgi:(E)-4-hydroxy-3-methylbut-2-enyl-diphosphate synthase